MFQKHTRYIVTPVKYVLFSSLHLKCIGICYQTEGRRKNPDIQHKQPFAHHGETCSDMTVFHFRRFIVVEPQFFGAIIFHPSSCMITSCEMTLYTFQV